MYNFFKIANRIADSLGIVPVQISTEQNQLYAKYKSQGKTQDSRLFNLLNKYQKQLKIDGNWNKILAQKKLNGKQSAINLATGILNNYVVDLKITPQQIPSQNNISLKSRTITGGQWYYINNGCYYPQQNQDEERRQARNDIDDDQCKQQAQKQEKAKRLAHSAYVIDKKLNGTQFTKQQRLLMIQQHFDQTEQDSDWVNDRMTQIIDQRLDQVISSNNQSKQQQINSVVQQVAKVASGGGWCISTQSSHLKGMVRRGNTFLILRRDGQARVTIRFESDSGDDNIQQVQGRNNSNNKIDGYDALDMLHIPFRIDPDSLENFVQKVYLLGKIAQDVDEKTLIIHNLDQIQDLFKSVGFTLQDIDQNTYLFDFLSQIKIKQIINKIASQDIDIQMLNDIYTIGNTQNQDQRLIPIYQMLRTKLDKKKIEQIIAETVIDCITKSPSRDRHTVLSSSLSFKAIKVLQKVFDDINLYQQVGIMYNRIINHKYQNNNHDQYKTNYLTNVIKTLSGNINNEYYINLVIQNKNYIDSNQNLTQQLNKMTNSVTWKIFSMSTQMLKYIEKLSQAFNNNFNTNHNYQIIMSRMQLLGFYDYSVNDVLMINKIYNNIMFKNEKLLKVFNQLTERQIKGKCLTEPQTVNNIMKLTNNKFIHIFSDSEFIEKLKAKLIYNANANFKQSIYQMVKLFFQYTPQLLKDGSIINAVYKVRIKPWFQRIQQSIDMSLAMSNVVDRDINSMFGNIWSQQLNNIIRQKKIQLYGQQTQLTTANNWFVRIKM